MTAVRATSHLRSRSRLCLKQFGPVWKNHRQILNWLLPATFSKLCFCLCCLLWPSSAHQVPPLLPQAFRPEHQSLTPFACPTDPLQPAPSGKSLSRRLLLKNKLSFKDATTPLESQRCLFCLTRDR